MELDRGKHLKFLQSLDSRVNLYEYWQTEHLRVSGIYWALTALFLLEHNLRPNSTEFDQKSPLTRNDLLQFVVDCQCSKGGFGGNSGHDAHLTFTLSAVQILVMIEALDDPRLNWDQHVSCKQSTRSL